MTNGLGAVVLGLVVLTGISIICLSYLSHPMDLVFVSAVAIVGSVALGYYTRDK